MPLERPPHYQGYFSQQDCSTEPFLSLISETLPLTDLNFASAIEKNIPIYDTRIVDDILRSSSRQDLLAEWAYVIGERSGIVVLKQAILDLDAVDEATEIFSDIIEEERQTSSGGDHFGERGANDRIWNSLQK
ncbi:MAG: phytanoyl-CoA dioxygenase, partial [Paracoccaceae bacterium]